MAMNFEELDGTTRAHMRTEFEAEEASGNPYRGKNLSTTGLSAFSSLMRAAIENGDEESFGVSLQVLSYWNPTESYERNGIVRPRQVNIQQASERLALTEFNTWYVRGLTKRLINEGITECQAYRGATPKWEPADCAAHEGQMFLVQDIYSSHRARYWPEPGTSSAVSIPFGPGCHHTIRRITK